MEDQYIAILIVAAGAVFGYAMFNLSQGVLCTDVEGCSYEGPTCGLQTHVMAMPFILLGVWKLLEAFGVTSD